MLQLPEQIGEGWELSKKQYCSRKSGALDRKLLSLVAFVTSFA
jgi:hypothetical protein